MTGLRPDSISVRLMGCRVWYEEPMPVSTILCQGRALTNLRAASHRPAWLSHASGARSAWGPSDEIVKVLAFDYLWRGTHGALLVLSETVLPHGARANQRGIVTQCRGQ